MKQPGIKPRIVLLNLLAAVAVSLIANFSSLIFAMMMSSMNEGRHMRWMPAIPNNFLIIEFLFFVLFGFILISICTHRLPGKDDWKNFTLRVIIALAVTVIFYAIAPKFNMRGEKIIANFQARNFVDSTLILKCSFTLIVAVLYGKIFDLIYQKQTITLENEVLKNENLQATYSTLVSQVNPHFLFNSLNSLSMLVREKHTDKALDYINQLSDTFRYIIQNGHAGMTTLSEEIKFLASYAYLMEIRYEGKLFFDIDIDPKYAEWTLPSLTLQPLIENAVKHNSITRSNPFTITIRTEGDSLVISNPIIKKLENADGTGIGLKNLGARCLLLTGREIRVEDDGQIFSVSIPLTRME